MFQTKPPYRVSLVAFLILFETVPYHKKSINAMIPSKSQFSTLIVAHLSNKRNLLFPWKIARRFRFNKNTLWPNDDPSSATLLRLVNTSLFRKSCGRLIGGILATASTSILCQNTGDVPCFLTQIHLFSLSKSTGH